MNIGYIRVSTKDQNEARQVETMRKLGIEERFIFIDKATGKDFNREKYQAMRLTLREGDCLYLDSLDRLGRNYDQVIAEWKYITREMKCDIICIDMEDTFNSKKFREMGDVGKVMEDVMLSMLSYVAETELKKNHERQRQGIEIAKAQGKYKGRKPKECKNFEEIANKWVSGELKMAEAMKQANMSKTTYLKKCKELGIKKER